MPLYTYRCDVCAKFKEEFRLVANRHNAPSCCGELTSKVVTAARVKGDLEGYTSPIDGRWIEGSRARTEDLKRNNCIPYDLDFKAEVLSKQDKLLKSTEQSVDRIVEETAAQLGFN